MPQNAKTTFKQLRPEDVWHPKSGPPFKNRNAVKTGLHTAEIRALRNAIQHLRRRARAAIAKVNVEDAPAFYLPLCGEVVAPGWHPGDAGGGQFLQRPPPGALCSLPFAIPPTTPQRGR
jgi:hypothetical protein